MTSAWLIWTFIIIAVFTIPASIGYAGDYIPDKAYKYNVTIKENVDTHFNELNEAGYAEYIPSLIEHESCISLTHKRCWEPTSRLKTQREEGAGLGQLTRTYRKDGTIRFDSLTDMRNRYRESLKELTWKNVYQRPDLQIRAITLMSRENYLRLSDVPNDFERISFMDAAYNGGLKGVYNDRRLCGLTKGCDPNVWLGNVENTCTKSTKAIYDVRSPCYINRHHVKDVMLYNLPKYVKEDYFNQPTKP